MIGDSFSKNFKDGSSRPVRTCPFDLITLYHFVYIFHFFFFSVIYLALCNLCNVVVVKKKERKETFKKQLKFGATPRLVIIYFFVAK